MSAFDFAWITVGVLGVITGVALVTVTIAATVWLLKCQGFRAELDSERDKRIRVEVDLDELMARAGEGEQDG